MKFPKSKLSSITEKDTKKREQNDQTLAPETAKRLAEEGCQACPLRKEWSRLRNPGMEMHRPSPNCEMLIIGEAPGQKEDEVGIPFVGNSGGFLRSILKNEAKKLYPANRSKDEEIAGEYMYVGTGIWWTNTIRCRPPGNRSPTPTEIACCSKFLENDLREAAPKVVLGVGNAPLRALVPSNELPITLSRGNCFTVYKKHHFVFIPTFHPSYLLRQEEESPDQFFFRDDIRQALGIQKSVLPNKWQAFLFPFYRQNLPCKEDHEHGGWAERSGVTYIYNMYGMKKLQDTMDKIALKVVVGFDIEATALRPYDGEKIISYALSNGYDSVSVIVNHSLCNDPAYEEKVLSVLYKFLTRTDVLILAHNIKFELEWVGHLLGMDPIMKVGKEPTTKYYGDSLVLKYILPSHPDARQLSLDDLCLLYLGFDLKSMYELDMGKIYLYPIQTVLDYNVGDVIVLPFLYKLLMGYVQSYQLQDTYEMVMSASLSAAKAQVDGLPVNPVAVNKMEVPLREALQKTYESLRKSKEFQVFKDTKGRFPNLNSSEDKQYILYNILELEVINNKDGNPSAAKDILYKYADVSSTLADMVAVMEIEKFLRDTSGAMLSGRGRRGDRVVYSDGKIHTNFNVTFTRTGRSSSRPNVQNLPKRNPRFKGARDVIGFSPDQADKWTIIGVDSGQIDFRLAGMSSLDTNFVKAVREGLDVHAVYAHHVAKLAPSKYKAMAEYIGQPDSVYTPDKMDPVVKAIRQQVKSGFVFAKIYRAGVMTMARAMGVEPEVIEELTRIFNKDFPGISEWHKDLYNFYENNQLIRSITGTLLYGPMGFGDVANYGIQHATRFLVAHMMKRLSIEYGYSVPNEVHDENMLIVPADEVDDIVPIVGEVFCKVPFEWAQVVPLTCEIKRAVHTETGIGWGNMETIKEYSSYDFGWEPRPVDDFYRFYERQFQKVTRQPVYF